MRSWLRTDEPDRHAGPGQCLHCPAHPLPDSKASRAHRALSDGPEQAKQAVSQAQQQLATDKSRVSNLQRSSNQLANDKSTGQQSVTQAETQLADDKTTAQQSISQAQAQLTSDKAQASRTSAQLKPARNRQVHGQQSVSEAQTSSQTTSPPASSRHPSPGSTASDKTQGAQSVSQAKAQLASDKPRRAVGQPGPGSTSQRQGTGRTIGERGQGAARDRPGHFVCGKATMALDKSSLSADQQKEAVDCKGNGAAGGVISSAGTKSLPSATAARFGRLFRDHGQLDFGMRR